MKRRAIFWVLIPICSTLYQAFAKLTADHMQEQAFSLGWLQQAGATPWLWAALACEIAAFAVWLQILGEYELSKAYPMTAVSYVFILAVSWFGFNEDILWPQLFGGALILCGVLLIGRSDSLKEMAG
ncbi:MAG: transporter [Alphaproteobacteria bacterium]|nr:transporter [Alphaproteobacteria bacterium]